MGGNRTLPSTPAQRTRSALRGYSQHTTEAGHIAWETRHVVIPTDLQLPRAEEDDKHNACLLKARYYLSYGLYIYELI